MVHLTEIGSVSEDQGSSLAAPTTEVNLAPSSSSIADDLTEDPSAAGSVPPPTTREPWRALSPPQVLSVRTFEARVESGLNNTNGTRIMDDHTHIGTRQNSYNDEEEEMQEPLTPQMASNSSRQNHYSSYHNRLTPKIMGGGGGAPSLTSSTRSVKSMGSSIVGHYFPDAPIMPPNSVNGIHDTPSIRSDLAGWVIDAPRNAAGINPLDNEHQQRGVPLVVVEKQPTHARVSIRGHSHHGSSASGTTMGGMNSSLIGLKKAIQDVQMKLESSLKDMQESNTRDLERCMYYA